MSLPEKTMQAEPSLAVAFSWQADQWQKITGLLASDRLPHALLLQGMPAIGKRRFAVALAHYLLCQQKQGTAACGQCRACHLNKVGTHPDLALITPEQGAKQIKIDQVRKVADFLNQTAQQDGRKVILLQPAEAMNIYSANALLKSLEEPAADNILLLVSDAPSRLLPTIRSRCQSIAFPQPDRALALAWLTGLVAEDQAAQLLDRANGRPLAALQLHDSDGLNRLKTIETDFAEVLLGRQSALVVAEKWLEYDLDELLACIRSRVAQLVAYRCAKRALDQHWKNLADNMPTQALFALDDKMAVLQAKLNSGANPNPQLLLEGLLLESCDIFR